MGFGSVLGYWVAFCLCYWLDNLLLQHVVHGEGRFSIKQAHTYGLSTGETRRASQFQVEEKCRIKSFYFDDVHSFNTGINVCS
jgi:hypothetical protein